MTLCCMNERKRTEDKKVTAGLAQRSVRWKINLYGFDWTSGLLAGRLSVCQSVSLSFTSISRRSLKTKRWNLCSDLILRSLVLKLRSWVMAWFTYLDCRGWRSGLYWRQNRPNQVPLYQPNHSCLCLVLPMHRVVSARKFFKTHTAL